MSKENFSKMFMAGMLMLPTIILIIAWFVGGGKVVEETMFQEVAKWVFMDGTITMFIALPFGYILAPFFYHWIYDKKDKKDKK